MSVWQFSEKSIELPFSISIDLELQMLTKEGLFLGEEDMTLHMQNMVVTATELFLKDLDLPNFPKLIRERITGEPYATQKKRKGSVISLNYNTHGKNREVVIFGRAENANSILECITPLCTNLDELVWWCQELIAISEHAFPKDIFLISTGFNPIQQGSTGMSCGTHYHLGNFKDEKEKIKVYNTIRNFIPHIIALTANSPFINGAPTGDVQVVGEQYVAPDCTRSIRLRNDFSLFSQPDPRYYIPYLDPGQDPSYFLGIINKGSLEEAQMQDLIPYTKSDSIELRICDAQLSISRTIGIALTLQALALLARGMKIIPDAGSQSLVSNRWSAITNGLFGPFNVEQIPFREMMLADSKFTEFYLGDLKKNKLHAYLYEAVQNMFLSLKEIMRKQRFADTPFIESLLLSVFGDIDLVKAPFTESEYQLYLYLKNQRHINTVLKELILLLVKCCDNPIYSPISGKLKKQT